MKHSEITKEKIRKAHLGMKRSEAVKSKISASLIAWYRARPANWYRKPFSHHTLQTKQRLSEMWKGSKGSNWKGGITSLNKQIRCSLNYRLWREAIFKRDNWTCVWCKQRGGILHPDHIKMFAFYPELRFEPSNGQTLCIFCHKWKTKLDNRIYRGQTPELNIV